MDIDSATKRRDGVKVGTKAPLGFEPRISCLLDRRFNQLSHGAKVDNVVSHSTLQEIGLEAGYINFPRIFLNLILTYHLGLESNIHPWDYSPTT